MSRAAVWETVAVLVGGAVAGTLVWLVFLLGSYRARPDLCLVAGLAIAACWRLVRSMVPAPEVEPSTRDGAESLVDGFGELTSLEHRLSWGSVDADRFAERVRPLLVELAQERLRSRHGVDPATRPEQARRIVGESLWQLMTAPPARRPSRAELGRLVDDLERI